MATFIFSKIFPTPEGAEIAAPDRHPEKKSWNIQSGGSEKGAAKSFKYLF
jgi:hypothetical protein